MILSDVLLNVVFIIEGFPFQSVLQAMDKSNNRMLQMQTNTAGWIEEVTFVVCSLCLHERGHIFGIDERNAF